MLEFYIDGGEHMLETRPENSADNARPISKSSHDELEKTLVKTASWKISQMHAKTRGLISYCQVSQQTYDAQGISCSMFAPLI